MHCRNATVNIKLRSRTWIPCMRKHHKWFQQSNRDVLLDHQTCCTSYSFPHYITVLPPKVFVLGQLDLHFTNELHHILQFILWTGIIPDSTVLDSALRLPVSLKRSDLQHTSCGEAGYKWGNWSHTIYTTNGSWKKLS